MMVIHLEWTPEQSRAGELKLATDHNVDCEYVKVAAI